MSTLNADLRCQRKHSTSSSEPFEEPVNDSCDGGGGFSGGGFIGGAEFDASVVLSGAGEGAAVAGGGAGGGGSFGAATSSPTHQDPMSPDGVGSFGTIPSSLTGAMGSRRELTISTTPPPGPTVTSPAESSTSSNSGGGGGFFRYKMFIRHERALCSTLSTPQRTSPRPLSYEIPLEGTHAEEYDDNAEDNDDFELPEGTTDSDQRSFNCSFATRMTGVEVEPPMVSDLAMGSGIEGGNSALVIGDTTGRIAIWEDPHQPASNLRMMGRTYSDIDRLSLQVSHQAFLPETDPLRSRAIDEKVNCVTVLPSRSPGVISYLACNESTIKLFRVRAGVNDTMRTRKSIVPRSAFTGRHQRPIVRLSLSADRETFLSADDFVVNWWHLDSPDTSKATCIVDAQPDGDVSEIYFSAKFSPVHSSLFVMASSSGRCDVGDLRDPPSRKPRGFVHQLEAPEVTDPACEEHKDILSSMSDASFIDNHHIVTRDYLGIKLWDLRRAQKPVSSCQVMKHLVPHLDALYANDAIFDHFNLATDHTTKCVVTGLYEGSVAVWYPLLRGGQQKESLEIYHIGADGGRDSYSRIEEMPATEDVPVTRNQVKKVAISEGGARIACAFENNVFAMDYNGRGSGSGRAGRRSSNLASPPNLGGRTTPTQNTISGGSSRNCDPLDDIPPYPSRTLQIPGVGPTGLTLRRGSTGGGSAAGMRSGSASSGSANNTATNIRRLPAASGATNVNSFKIPKRLSRKSELEL